MFSYKSSPWSSPIKAVMTEPPTLKLSVHGNNMLMVKK